MAKFTKFTGYQGDAPPTIPKPETPPDPMIVTVQEGVPVASWFPYVISGE